MTRTRAVLATTASTAGLGTLLLVGGAIVQVRGGDVLAAVVTSGVLLLFGAVSVLLVVAVLLLDRARRAHESIRSQGSRTAQKVDRLAEEVGQLAAAQAGGLEHMIMGLRATEEATRAGTRRLESMLHDHDGPVRSGVRAELEQSADADGALGHLLRQELTALYGQVEGALHLERLLELPAPLGPLGGFAVRADLAAYLVRLCRRQRPRAVVETGSGVSTVLLAALMRETGGEVLALEHDPRYAADTRQFLEEYGVSSYARVVHAPLTPVQVEGEDFHWYDLSAVDLPDEIELLFVDGPPGSTGSLARFPAVPLLQQSLGPRAIVLLDDAWRADERTAAERWEQLLPSHTVRYLDHLVGTAEFQPHET